MKVLIVGLGEVGSALYEIVKGVQYDVVGYDIKNVGTVLEQAPKLPSIVDVLHVCFPYSDDFVDQVVDYVIRTNPRLVLIESTVLPGTTSAIADLVKTVFVVHSPVRARKADGIKWGLYNYTKFIGACDGVGASYAEEYYKSLGFKTHICSGSLETEFAKLIHLAYFGIMLGWNQEMRRLASEYGINFGDIAAFLGSNTDESANRFPVPIYDGKPIGGHCIIHGIKTLRECFPSKFLDAVLESNEKREKNGAT